MAEKKSKVKRGLGKNLIELLDEKKAEQEEQNQEQEPKQEGSSSAKETGEVMLPIGKIFANENQPRKNFDEEALAELTESVRQYGVLQPLIVQKEDKGYRIIAGERRYRAAKEAGLSEIPVIIREYSNQLAAEISIIENVQRADLNPMEEAMAYQMLQEDYGLKQEEIAARVSKNRTTVTNAIRLLKLSKPVQELIAAGTLSAGHGRTLISVEDEELQLSLANQIIQEDLNVRETERLVKAAGRKKKPKDKQEQNEKERMDLFFSEYEEHIKSILGTKVHIHRRDRNKGKIEIDYYSTAELERLMELFHQLRQS